MIYIVECNYDDPDTEQDWNKFYSLEKLPALISVTGFITSQRLEAITSNAPRYLAIHTIENPAILSGNEYRQKGGGSFAKWQNHISHWHRNVYDTPDRFPEVTQDSFLYVSHVRPENLSQTFYHSKAIALDKDPLEKWMWIGSDMPHFNDEIITKYKPLTKQLKSHR